MRILIRLAAKDPFRTEALWRQSLCGTSGQSPFAMSKLFCKQVLVGQMQKMNPLGILMLTTDMPLFMGCFGDRRDVISAAPPVFRSFRHHPTLGWSYLLGIHRHVAAPMDRA